jgi:dCMP deaminase
MAVASKSPCHSRQIGAILVRDKSIVATGYNGPPRDVPHCKECPRKAQGYASGEGLHLCPATHAEANCIINAARLGVVTLETTLYMNCIIPCWECMKLLINAGISEIVVDSAEQYHTKAAKLIEHGSPWVREFSL